MLNASVAQAGDRAPVQAARQPMTYEDYLALPNEGRIVEWANEEAVYLMPPLTIHQDIVAYLTAVLSAFITFHNLGRLLVSAFEMRCHPDGPSREPDVLFVASGHLSQLTDRRLEGPADLVVEIVSEDSVSRDYDEKFVEYQECGIPEYWVVDPRPRRQRALFYQLDANRQYDLVKPVDGVYRSQAIPGFWLRVNWLWDRPDPVLTFGEISALPPAVMDALRALKAAQAPNG